MSARRLVAAVATVAALAAGTATIALAAGAHTTRLTPLEQKWVTPLLSLYTAMNANLTYVIREASEPNALVIGSGKNYNALATTILVFEECGARLKQLGKPPTPRMTQAWTSFAGLCTHLYAGGHDFALAIKAVSTGKKKPIQTDLANGVAEFNQANTFLRRFKNQMLDFGGQAIFKA